MTLEDAITQVEQAKAKYGAAVTLTGQDRATADVIQTKLEAAKSVVDSDLDAQSKALGGEKEALLGLIAAAQSEINALP